MTHSPAILSASLILASQMTFVSDAVAQPQRNPNGRSQTSSVERYEPRDVLKHPIRAIRDPEIVSAAESDLADNELVIGVVVNGQARAYPINQLTGPQREIINDVLGETPIAATW